MRRLHCRSRYPSRCRYEISTSLLYHNLQRVGGLADASGLDLGGWEDGFIDGHESPYNRSKVNNRNAIAYAWQNVWEWKKSNRAYKLANAGYQVAILYLNYIVYVEG